MQTKSSGIFINDYNLSRTTRKSVKINSTSTSLLCNLCLFPLKAGLNDRETVHFTEYFLQHSCALHYGKFEFLFCAEEPLFSPQKIEIFYKSRTRLAFCQKPFVQIYQLAKNYRIAEYSRRDQVHFLLRPLVREWQTAGRFNWLRPSFAFVNSQC